MSCYFSSAKRECRSPIIKRNRRTKSVIDAKFVLLIEDAFSVYWPEQSSQFFMFAKPNYFNKLIYPLHSFSLLTRLVECAMKLILR